MMFRWSKFPYKKQCSNVDCAKNKDNYAPDGCGCPTCKPEQWEE